MLLVSDIIPNPMSAFSEEGTAGRSQGKCFRRDSVRREDGLTKTLTFWVTRCGTELKSRPSPRFCVKYPSSVVSTVGKTWGDVTLIGTTESSERAPAVGTLLGHVPFYLLNSSINVY